MLSKSKILAAFFEPQKSYGFLEVEGNFQFPEPPKYFQYFGGYPPVVHC